QRFRIQTFEQLKTPQAEPQGRGTIADNRAPLSSSTRAQTGLVLRDARTEAAFGHAEQNRYTARRIAQGDPGIRLDDETIVRPFFSMSRTRRLSWMYTR